MYLVVLIFTNEYVEWEMPKMRGGRWSVVMTNSTNVLSDQGLMGTLKLWPYDGVICRLETISVADCDC
jgi:hypothetical protein